MVHQVTSRWIWTGITLLPDLAPDHRNTIAQPNLGLPDSLERNRAERHKGGVFEVDSIRNFCTKLFRDVDHFGMRRIVLSGTGNAIANREPARILSYFQHSAGTAVSESCRRIEPFEDSLDRFK